MCEQLDHKAAGEGGRASSDPRKYIKLCSFVTFRRQEIESKPAEDVFRCLESAGMGTPRIGWGTTGCRMHKSTDYKPLQPF